MSLRCCVFKNFLKVFGFARVHLSREMHDLRAIPWILEQYHILSIQIDGAILLVFIEQILYDRDAADPSMMAGFCKQFGDSAICFIHQIVDNHQSSWLQLFDVWQSFYKINIFEG